MRSGVEGRQFSFNLGKELTYCRPILLPGEMDGDAILLVCRTHPEIIGGNGPDLRNEQVWANHVAQSFYRENGLDCVTARNEVFRLQFLAGTGHESHSEVWQTRIPGTGHTHLFRAVLGRKFCDWVQVLSRDLRAEQLCLGVELGFGISPRLEPDFIDALLLPVGEQADTVGACLNCIEIVLQLIKREIFINVLPDGKCRLQVEREFGDHTQSAEADNGTTKRVTIFVARQLQDIA